ncbi:MAG: hypothetical protein ACREUM_11465 [Nitrosospira sp.]
MNQRKRKMMGEHHTWKLKYLALMKTASDFTIIAGSLPTYPSIFTVIEDEINELITYGPSQSALAGWRTKRHIPTPPKDYGILCLFNKTQPTSPLLQESLRWLERLDTARK